MKIMKMMKNDNDKYKLIFVWFGAFFFMVLMMIFSFRSKAASDQDYFPMEQNKNQHFTQNQIDKIAQFYDDTNNYIFVIYGGDAPGYNGRMKNFYVCYFPKSVNTGFVYAEKSNNLYQFSLYTYGNISPNYRFFQILEDNWTYDYSSSMGTFQGLISSNYDNTKDYISNFMLITNNNPQTAKIVLLYDDGISVPDGDTARDDMEKPDSADYYPDWTNAPTFDNSTVENALQSIFNYFVWFGGNIKGTIEGLGNFISDTVRWSIQKVLDRITSTAQDLLSGIQSKINDVITQIGNKIDSFTSKLEDLYDGFTDFADLFIHPFDEEEFEEQIANCQLISQYDELMENCEDIRAIFNNAEERDYFVLYIDFENPFADSEHKIIHSEISFTWLKDYRTTYRPFLWVFTMIECFVGGMRLLGGIIGGKAK